MGPLSADSRFNMEAYTVVGLFCFVFVFLFKVPKVCLNGELKRLPEDGLLKRSCRCLLSLGLVLTKGF